MVWKIEDIVPLILQQNITIFWLKKYPFLIHNFFFPTYSCASKRGKKAFPAVKEVPQGSCQTKKMVYELKSPSKEVKSSKVSFSVQGGNYSVKDNDPVGSIKTVERGSPKSFRVNSVCSQRQATSQGSCDDKSHHRMSSKVKRPLLSEHEQKIQKIFGRARKRSRNEKNCNFTKTRELVKAKSISEKLLMEDKGRLLKDLCAKRLHGEAETSSASSLSKDTTSRTKSISNAIENASPVKLAPCKSATSESPKQPVWSAEATPLPNFKIPKMSHHAENTAKNSSSESSNRNCKHAIELFKFKTVHQSDIRCDGSQILSSDTKNERPSSSSHLPDVSTTVAHPCHDEVINTLAADTLLLVHVKKQTYTFIVTVTSIALL